MRLLNNRKVVKALSLLLAIAMLFGMFQPMAVPVLAVEQEATPYVMVEGETVTEAFLSDGDKLCFEVGCGEDVAAYQWQIQEPQDGIWVNIAGGNTAHLWVSHALVGSMLSADGVAQLRCRLETADGEMFTDAVAVYVPLIEQDEAVAYQLMRGTAPDTESVPETEQSAPMMMLSANNTEPELKTYSIVINYLFDDNTIAFEPYGATVAAGSPFKPENPIKSPQIMGYAPFRQLNGEYVEAPEVAFALDSVDADIVINVIYEPTLVNFQVHHHFQNILNDDYAAEPQITNKQGLTGSHVGSGLAFTEAELPGFRSLAYDETLVVAADGSTVVEIRYDRNYYLVSYDLSGGYGTEPVYTRFGATVGVNDPTRHGYVFDGWELVSYDGQTPTNEQKTQYALQSGGTIEVPAANLKYQARWITENTTYTMVFWCENANDNGYSYWGYLDGLSAKSGTYVSAQDYISRVDGIDDEEHFTFNAAKSDKNVLVEGDGSTVVNVYYTRKYYTITFRASGTCILPTSHTHTDACYDLICGLGHVHTAECIPDLTCTTPEHTSHTDACLICGKQKHIHGLEGCDCKLEEHSHVKGCWNNVGNAENPWNAPRNPEDGYIHRSLGSYYIYISGTWYRYDGKNVSNKDVVDPACNKENHTHGTDCVCNQEAHIHNEDCYRDSLHTHSEACYTYSCGAIGHTHDNTCKRLICGIPTSHSHSNEGTSSKVVKIVYAKYRQSLKDIWPITDGNGVTYNDGQRWEPSGSDTYEQVLVYIDEMPGDDFTLTVNTSTSSPFTMNYYLQVLPGEKYDVTYNGKQYVRYTQIKAKYSRVTKAEDFFPIRGYTQAASDPSFGNGTSVTPSDRIVDFYYDRIVDHTITFNSNGIVLNNKTVTGVMYGESVAAHNFVPDYPTNLEPNAYTFGGWYTSPGCFDGTEMDWENTTMPEGDLLLYAKWTPITHTVKVYLDKDKTQQIGETQVVDHGAFAHAPAGNISNGNYMFLGWFYEDIVNGEKVEKAFVFNGIPVLDDMDIYARWGAHFSVDYKIYYKLAGEETEIASPTTGSAIVGNNKTFYAKTGVDLNSGFQTGYYPQTNSHTITMSATGNHEFTFYYEYVESMPYKVQYLDENGNKVFEDKYVWDNNLSVVTETFQRKDKMMPDAYQKRLVLSSNKTDSDGDGIYDANVITFYYKSDEEHAYYHVVHYIENIAGGTYRAFSSEDNVGIIGQKYTGSVLALTGFVYNGDKTMINGVLTPSAGTSVEVTLTADGVLIEFYYDRLDYQYQVQYIDNRTNQEVHTAKTAEAPFGEQIVEYALNLESSGYELVGENIKLLTVSANPGNNVIKFYYQEKTVALKYQIVGPDGCGSLSRTSENVTAISGVPDGSYPYVQTGFLFQGWYTDPDCTTPVDSSWVNSDNHLKPQKSGEVWTTATYYAKFVALETDLIITTTSTVDADQVFIFTVKGKAGTDTAEIDLTVTVIGNSSVTVTKLPVGEYTVTELTDWSWRYENAAAAREVNLTYNDGNANEIVYNNSREHGKWLDGNDCKDNRF